MDSPQANARRTLTSPDGPAIVSRDTLLALIAIRKLPLLEKLFGRVAISRAVFNAVATQLGEKPEWLIVVEDQAAQPLPERVAGACALDTATLRLAIALPASVVLIDGPIKDKAKLSFIKCEGTVALLVEAHQKGFLSAVQPMVKALAALGHGHVLPPQNMLDALWTALDKL